MQLSFYCEGGESNSETIIFLHGSGPGATSETNWRDILPALTDRYHVIAPDMYGFGNTKHPETPPKSFWEWTDCRVEQVLELMDHLKVDTAKLVGNSMGGYVSLNLVMTAPERFEKIMLMGSAGGAASRTPEIGRMIGFYKNPTHAALKNLTKWFVYDEKSLGEELESVLRERYEMIIRPEVKRSYLNNMFPGRGEILIPPSALRRMEQPFLLVHGFEDRFVTKESSLSMMQYLPNAQLHLIKGCGHWIQIEKRELVNKIGSIEEAVEIVNDSRFGLQASIYTNNVKNAFYASEELHVGGVVINDVPTFRVDQMPYGGVKDSGTGREGIKYAVEEMTEMKLIVWNQN